MDCVNVYWGRLQGESLLLVQYMEEAQGIKMLSEPAE